MDKNQSVSLLANILGCFCKPAPPAHVQKSFSENMADVPSEAYNYILNYFKSLDKLEHGCNLSKKCNDLACEWQNINMPRNNYGSDLFAEKQSYEETQKGIAKILAIPDCSPLFTIKQCFLKCKAMREGIIPESEGSLNVGNIAKPVVEQEQLDIPF